MWRLGFITASLAVGLACSPGGAGKDAEGGDESDTADPSDTGPKSDTDEPLPPPEGYWGVGGALHVVGGAVDPASSLVLHHDDGGVICEVTAEITTAEPDLTLPPGHAAWWTWTVDVADDAPCLWRGPTTIHVGLGPTDPQLDPAAARKGLVASTAYGLYFDGLDGTAVVAGIAGTAEQLAGAGDPPVTAPPLPDGVYALHTFYGLVIP